MNQAQPKPRSLLFFAGLAIILLAFTGIFYHRISAILKAENEEALVAISEQYARSLAAALENSLHYLNGVADAASHARGSPDWPGVQASLARLPSAFSRAGVVDQGGAGIVGPSLPLDAHPGLRLTLAGDSAVTLLPKEHGDAPSRFLFSAPITRGNDVRYALYGIQDAPHMQRVLANVLAGQTDISAFIIDGDDNVILSPPSPPACPDDGAYVSVVPLRLNGWRLVSTVPCAAMRAGVDSAMKLFLFILVALAILVVAVLAHARGAGAAYRAKLHTLAYVDRLTGLPNWEKIKLELPALMASGHGAKNWLLVTFDIKQFKYINEMLGYQGGNDILAGIAASLRHSGDDGVYLPFRHENDCFAYLTPADAPGATEKIRARLDSLAQAEGFGRQRLRFSCGACAIPAAAEDGGGHNWNACMNSARLAREQSKKRRDTNVAVYDTRLKQRLLEAKELQGDLDEALANEDFEVYLQPKYTIADRGREKLTGAEALIRWNHRTRGFLPPGVFIPIFEEDGSIEKLDRYVFVKTCQHLARWMAAPGGRPLPVSVNLSRVQLSNPSLIGELTEITDRYRVPRGLLDIELTETSSFGDIDLLIQTMHNLKRCGFQISLDDFGTGYSSLSLLRDMPMDILKLDKSFIDPWRDEEKSHQSGVQFVRDIIRMADNQGIQTLAEGVETVRQLEILRAIECDIVQGYYFHKPMPVAQYEELLTAEAGA